MAIHIEAAVTSLAARTLPSRLPISHCQRPDLASRDPVPAQMDQFDAELKRHGKAYEFHRYDGRRPWHLLPHTPMYWPEQAMDGWEGLRLLQPRPVRLKVPPVRPLQPDPAQVARGGGAITRGSNPEIEDRLAGQLRRVWLGGRPNWRR